MSFEWEFAITDLSSVSERSFSLDPHSAHTMPCLPTVVASFLIILFRFLGRLILCVLVLAFAFVLAVLAFAFALAGLALVFVPQTNTGHRLAVIVLLCSSDLASVSSSRSLRCSG